MGELFRLPHLIILLIVPLFLAIFIVPYWRIFARTGFPGALSLLMIVPLANIVLLYVIAYSDWKTDTAASATGTPYPLPGQLPPQPPALS